MFSSFFKIINFVHYIPISWYSTPTSYLTQLTMRSLKKWGLLKVLLPGPGFSLYGPVHRPMIFVFGSAPHADQKRII